MTQKRATDPLHVAIASYLCHRMCVKRDLHLSKETCMTLKRRTLIERDLLTLWVWRSDRTCAMRCVSNGTYIYQKRPTYIKRDRHISKETCIYHKRPTYIQRDLHIWKETYIYQKMHATLRCVSNETYVHQKRPRCIKRKLHISKETYIYQKRTAWLKRDVHESKQTYWHCQRDAHVETEVCGVCQKRRKNMKRDLCIYIYETRPVRRPSDTTWNEVCRVCQMA